MADESTSTSINPSHHDSHSAHPHNPFAHDSDSDDHHSSHSGGSPGPSGTTDNNTATASGLSISSTCALLHDSPPLTDSTSHLALTPGFTHPHFQRDHPELLKLLKPRGSTRKSGSSSVAAKKAAAIVRDEEDRRGGLKRAASSKNKK
jgi:hypothetical protein